MQENESVAMNIHSQDLQREAPVKLGMDMNFKWTNRRAGCAIALILLVLSVVHNGLAAELFSVLRADDFAAQIERFNSEDAENITNHIPNSASWDWLQNNIPLFACPDHQVEELYYYRWWSFRKHIVQTTNGFIITEFLTPVRHADIFNTISCAASFHLAEGRWLRDPAYLNEYTAFWFHGDGGASPKKFHNFSSWLPSAAYDRYLVNQDRQSLVGLLGEFAGDYRLWEQERQLTNGLFWQYDVKDGMEESISGSRTNRNIRPTINSYMFANARAIAATARLAGQPELAAEFDAKAATLKRLTQQYLWDNDAKFFKVRGENGEFSDAREVLGYIPWMFGLPNPNDNYASAWMQFTDPRGFRAPYGITTAERRHPRFRSHGVGTCEWDGAIWPFATCQTLYALANLLRDYPQTIVNNRDYYDAFLTYVHSQQANGQPYLGEYLDEVTGDWINRNDRSRFYNHSTFADLLITGVIGLRPRADKVVEVNPLLPDGVWDWFCLDGVSYHGHTLTVLWDVDGSHYGRGKGLLVLADGKEIARGKKLAKLTGKLP
jgi:hypothetical protein